MSLTLTKPLDSLDLMHPTLGELRAETPNQYTYEISNNMQYLRQYFFIREYAYRLDLQLKHFSGQEDEIDQYSHFIIARKGHFCVGGARLTISTTKNRVKLPLEDENFSIRKAVPELESVNYCELGRTAVLPDYRSGDCLDNIFKLSAVVAHEFGCTHMMGVSPPAVARRFKAAYTHLGYKTEIRSDIKTPVKPIHEHLNLKFILVDLTSQED